MSVEEIRGQLETAFHEAGHAFAYVGEGRYLAALMAADNARKAIKLACNGLGELPPYESKEGK
ncbi:MAG: hypothetical protein II823_06775 [Kiritimatiellae bacterium]|nr:hypothetical protein [Kiritimatiellia bacterium]